MKQPIRERHCIPSSKANIYKLQTLYILCVMCIRYRDCSNDSFFSLYIYSINNQNAFIIFLFRVLSFMVLFYFIFLNLYLFVLLMIFVCIAVAYCQNHISRMVHIEKINRVKCISLCPCFFCCCLFIFYFGQFLAQSCLDFRI